MFLPFLALSLALLRAPAPAVPVQEPAADVAPEPLPAEPPAPPVRQALERLAAHGVRTPLADFATLAESGHPAALEALVRVCGDQTAPLLLRARAVRHLPPFADHAALEKRAFRALLDAATAAPERGLKLEAVEALGRAGSLGREYLGIVVDYGDDPQVRVAALERHGALARPEDGDWYRELLSGTSQKPARDPVADRGLQPVTEGLRHAAFELLRPQLEVPELSSLVSGPDAVLRRRALEALVERDAERGATEARARFERSELPLAERAAAGALYAPFGDGEFLERLVEFGSEPGLSREARQQVADAVAAAASDVLLNRLYRPLGRGSLPEQAFALAVLAHEPSGKVDAELRRLLREPDESLRRLAIEALAQRGGPEAHEQLVQQVAATEVLGEGATLVEAADRALGPGDGKEHAAFEARLREWAEEGTPEVRGAAIRALAGRGVERHRPMLEAQLAGDDWPRFQAALAALAANGTAADVRAIVAALPDLGLREQREAFRELWLLTGQPLGTNVEGWQRWCEAQSEDLPVLDERDRRLLAEEQRFRAENDGTSATFFGIAVQSQRVVFVLDVSGSMAEQTTWARESGATGGDRGYGRGQRIDVAKAELGNCLDRLRPNSLFNVVAFSDVVRSYAKDLERGGKGGVDKAKRFIERLTPSGGTNLYGGLRAAFEESDVDTIFLLSDGEPSVGEVRDPRAIRAAVQRWNAARGVRIHCVAIGVDLELLEWLTADSGGDLVKLR